MTHAVELAAVALALVALVIVQVSGGEEATTATSGGAIYNIPVKTIDGQAVTLDAWRGKLVMIVNVASKCGFTSQYEGLEKLYQQYKDRGFVILGFPSNDFMGQEPGTNEEIKQFCTLNYGVTFPMFEKIPVKGDDMHPLYVYLTDKKTTPQFAGKITWNFNKFLVGPDGSVVGRFGSRTKPESDEIRQAIETNLP